MMYDTEETAQVRAKIVELRAELRVMLRHQLFGELSYVDTSKIEDLKRRISAGDLWMTLASEEVWDSATTKVERHKNRKRDDK